MRSLILLFSAFAVTLHAQEVPSPFAPLPAGATQTENVPIPMETFPTDSSDADRAPNGLDVVPVPQPLPVPSEFTQTFNEGDPMIVGPESEGDGVFVGPEPEGDSLVAMERASPMEESSSPSTVQSLPEAQSAAFRPGVPGRPSCATVRCSPGTVCVMRRPSNCFLGRCIEQPACVPRGNTSPRPSCATVRCSPGTACVMRRPSNCFPGRCNEQPTCVPRGNTSPSPLSCANVRCQPGFVCQMMRSCQFGQCSNRPSCTRQTFPPRDPPSSCNTVRCSSGTVCRMIQVQCIRFPCTPQPQCVHPCLGVVCPRGTSCRITPWTSSQAQCFRDEPSRNPSSPGRGRNSHSHDSSEERRRRRPRELVPEQTKTLVVQKND